MKRALAAILLCLLPASCRPGASPRVVPVDLLVLAPHPDDETLIAGGVLESARARGLHAAVVVVTNGDFTCERDGHVRQGETVAAMARLGVAEEDVHFLGYPDGWLADLGEAPLPPIKRRARDGACVQEVGTYAERGEGGHDEHRARTGEPGAYVAASLEGDLVALLGRLRPRDVYVTHPLDSHPDHAATYVYLRRALDRLAGAKPRVHRAVVHAGPCWPNGRGLTEPCPAVDTQVSLPTPIPALPDPYAAYAPSEHALVPDPARKLAAIGEYRSQLGDDPDHDWLRTFARTDEPFWPDPLFARSPGVAVSLSRAAVDADVGPYHLTLSADADSVTLTRDGRKLRKWLLPFDGREGAHAFALAISAGDEGGREVAVERDGVLLGVTVDTTP
jgi:LmbE family N-acetylglucosaminyl deacetylase